MHDITWTTIVTEPLKDKYLSSLIPFMNRNSPPRAIWQDDLKFWYIDFYKMCWTVLLTTLLYILLVLLLNREERHVGEHNFLQFYM